MRGVVLFKLIIFSIIAGMIVYSCRDKYADNDTINFIDIMKDKNIVKSPFVMGMKAEFAKMPGKAISKNEARNNPYFLKRRLILAHSYNLLSIYSPPPSLYEFEMKIPFQSILEFGYGATRVRNISNYYRIKFIVRIKNLKGKELIVKEYRINPDMHFNTEKIDLSSLSGKKVKIELETVGNTNVKAFWYNPFVYKPAPKKINIILISVDTLRSDHLGCYGYYKRTSENIDKLAKDSVLFRNAYATSPWTLPSHMSMFTSLYVHNHRVYNQKQALDDSIITGTQLLRRNNYFTVAFTDGGFLSGLFGFANGFDLYHQASASLRLETSASSLYKKASKWLEENLDKSFFLFLHTYQPHDPYSTPSPYNLKFLDTNDSLKRVNLSYYLGGAEYIYKPLSDEEVKNIIALYDAEIYYTDQMLIQPLIKLLKKHNLYDKTMIIFTSDHGEQFYEHSGWVHGYNLYEETIKVPLIIKFPFNVYKGKVVNDAVSIVDIMPTILRVANSMKKDIRMDGINLLDVIFGKNIERIIISDVAPNIAAYRNPKRASLIKNSIKIIYNDKFTGTNYAFFKYPPAVNNEIELFDLIKDPYERNNITAAHSVLASAMLKKLLQFHTFDYTEESLDLKINNDLKEQLKALGYVK